MLQDISTSGGANYFSKVMFVFKVVFIFEVVFILEVVFIFEVILRRELFDRNMQNSDWANPYAQNKDEKLNIIFWNSKRIKLVSNGQ